MIKTKDDGITLITLVITIIILLILAGITISQLMGSNLLDKAKYSKEKTLIEQGREELTLKAQEVQIEKKGNATLSDFVQYLDKDEKETYVVSLTKTSSINGEIPDLTGVKEIYVTYKGYEYKVDHLLNVTYEGINPDNGKIYHKVTKEIDKYVQMSDTRDKVEKNATYETTLTCPINSGEVIDEVIVKMDGNDITSIAYSNNVISIENVTGDIEIKVTTAWDGTTISTGLEGNGTEEFPYLIKTSADLVYMSQKINEGITKINPGDAINAIDAYYKLENTIKLNKDSIWNTITDFTSTTTGLNQWTPIASEEIPFNGKFNGNNNTIRNLYINDATADNQSLFVANTINSEISNLSVQGEFIANSKVAGFIIINYGTIYNCHNYVKCGVNVGYVSGIAKDNYGSIIKCSNNATIQKLYSSGGYGNLAGICYSMYGNNAIVSQCVNRGKIDGKGSTTIYTIAGIVACIISGDCIIEYCYNEGQVIGGMDVGGIMGWAKGLEGNSKIQYCFSFGEISGGYSAALIGTANRKSDCVSYIDNCYYLSDLKADTLGTSKNANEMNNQDFIDLLTKSDETETIWKINEDGDHILLNWE